MKSGEFLLINKISCISKFLYLLTHEISCLLGHLWWLAHNPFKTAKWRNLVWSNFDLLPVNETDSWLTASSLSVCIFRKFLQQWFILGTRTPTYESEPAREYPTVKDGRQASYVVTRNLMKQESACFSSSERVKGDFEQTTIHSLKQTNTKGWKQHKNRRWKIM